MAFTSLTDAYPLLVLPAAFALNAAPGDPRRLPYLIRRMGRAIEIY